MGARGVALTRTAAALGAAGALAGTGVRALELAGGAGRVPIEVAVALAAAAVLAGGLDRRPALCGAGALAAALVYVVAVWRAGGDGAAALIAAAVFGSLELARLASELRQGAAGRLVARRLAWVGTAAIAAAGAAWLVLAAGSARAPGGIAATATGLAATVAAVAMVVRLGRA